MQGMLEDLGRAPQGSIVLLHACAHNPVRDLASAEESTPTLSPLLGVVCATHCL